MKIFGVRAQLIGDQVMALPVLNILKHKYPDCEITWAVANKVKQASGIWQTHPLINPRKIVISKDAEGNEYDLDMSQFDLVLNVNPPETGPDRYNVRNCVEEAVTMAGFSVEDLNKLPEEERHPQLYMGADYTDFFNRYKHQKPIALFPFAGYGARNRRSPSVEWWNDLISILKNRGFKTWHFGHDSEPELNTDYSFTKRDWGNQIFIAHHCVAAIGTDSGNMWVMGAYNLIPTFSLLTYHMPNHHQNPMALRPINSTAFFHPENINNIEQKEVALSLIEKGL